MLCVSNFTQQNGMNDPLEINLESQIIISTHVVDKDALVQQVQVSTFFIPGL